MSSVRFNLKKLLLSVLSVVIIAATVVSTVHFGFSSVKPAEAASVSEYQEYLKELEKEQQELQEEIGKLKGDKSEQQALKNALLKNIDNIKSQINTCNSRINDINSQITQLENDIVLKTEQLEETKYVFRQRLRAIYMSGGMSNSTLAVVFDADNLEELLSKSELTKSISAYDSALMKKIVDDMKTIEKSKAEVEELKKDQEATKAILNEKKQELDREIDSVVGEIDDIDDDIDKLQDKAEALEKAQKEYEQAIKDAQHVGSDQKYEGGQFAWPVPNYYYISSPYGYRYHPISGKYKFHKGVDISGGGIKGKPIVAAADGIVSLAKYNSGGYGYYVMINHGTDNKGDTYVTLYAHMTKYIVHVGQQVKKGQTIGYVGTTGASTGYHLHYEVRVNGNTTNPMSHY